MPLSCFQCCQDSRIAMGLLDRCCPSSPHWTSWCKLTSAVGRLPPMLHCRGGWPSWVWKMTASASSASCRVELKMLQLRWLLIASVDGVGCKCLNCKSLGPHPQLEYGQAHIGLGITQATSECFLCFGFRTRSLQPTAWRERLSPPLYNGVSFGHVLGRAYKFSTQCARADIPPSQ